VDGLRTWALSGENAGRGTYAVDPRRLARASPGVTKVGKTGCVPRVCIAISGPGSVGLSGVTVRSGDLSVLSI
jgi:hypothetical protein